MPKLQEDLEQAVQVSLAKKAAEAGIPVSEGAYTIESRNEMYLELAAQKEEKDRNERRRMGNEPKPARVIPGVYNARGEIRQCNEGKYDFSMDDWSDHTKIIFELAVPKYLDTTALDVDINPQYVRCVVKDKVTQLKLPQEVSPDASKVQRSRVTGKLRIDMPLVDARPDREQRPQPQPELKPLEPKDTKPTAPQPKAKAAVSVRGIYRDPKRVAGTREPELLREVRTTRAEGAGHGDDDDDDDDGVPPLVAPTGHGG